MDRVCAAVGRVKLTLGTTAPRPAPRRVTLGADGWVLLAETIAGAAALAPPFRVQDGPPLQSADRAAARRALRDAGLLTGHSGSLPDDLHASLRESLLVYARPLVVIDASVGLGDAQRVERIAVGGQLACGLVREQKPAGADALDLGPVHVTAMLVDDVATEVVSGFGDLNGEPGRLPLRLDAATSLAAVRALGNRRTDLAQAALGAAEIPPPLQELAKGLRSFARVDVASPVAARVLLALLTGDGWWSLDMSGEDVVMRPAGEDELVTMIANSLLGALRDDRAFDEDGSAG